MDPETPLAGRSKGDWDKLDRKERSTIRVCLPDLVLLNVSVNIMQRICGISWGTCTS